MALELTNLDGRTRELMLEEIEADIANGRLYISPRLSSRGQADYPSLLKEATMSHDASWLAGQLYANSRMNTEEQRRKSSGGFTTARVPHNAPDMLAEGEFNRFYMRGLCLRALEEGKSDLLVYRAIRVANPRPESEAKIGSHVDARTLLEDLRKNVGIDTTLKLPPGPNSGLSVRLS